MGAFSKLLSAASADPVFNVQSCRDLDGEIRRGTTEFPQLADEDFERLCADLNTIANGRRAQDAVGQMKTPMARLAELERIEKNCRALLLALGADPESPPWNVSIEHLIDGGIFEDCSFDYSSLVGGLKALSEGTSKRIDGLLKVGVGPQTRQPNLADYRLYDDLGAVYKEFWGEGQLERSVNDGKGGPSIRFFMFSLRQIEGYDFSPQKVLDAINKIKNDEVDLSTAYSTFTPYGGRRI